MLSVGDPAPDFEATDQRGKSVRLGALLEQGPVILYFYPKDFTPVCTAQACLFRDAEAELLTFGARVVGVSADSTASHGAFAKQHAVPFPLLSDADQRIRKAYEARQFLGLFPRRVTYVIGKDGRIRGAFHFELSAEKHLQAVREVLGKL